LRLSVTSLFCESAITIAQDHKKKDDVLKWMLNTPLDPRKAKKDKPKKPAKGVTE
jgi:hypothetical protein